MAHACEQGSHGLLAPYLHTALTVPHAQKASGPTRQGKSQWQDKVRMFCLPLSAHWLRPLPVMATWAMHAWASTPSSIRRLDKMLCKARPGSKVHWAWNHRFRSVVTNNKRHQVRGSAHHHPHLHHCSHGPKSSSSCAGHVSPALSDVSTPCDGFCWAPGILWNKMPTPLPLEVCGAIQFFSALPWLTWSFLKQFH